MKPVLSPPHLPSSPLRTDGILFYELPLPHSSTYIPLVTLAVVLLLIAVRKIGRIRLGIWQIMLGGAAAVLLTGQITPGDAFAAISPDVMLFLFGMFIVGEALSLSGALSPLSHRLLCRERSMDALMLTLILATGLLSALLMNDTVAIIGTPFVLHIASKYGVDPRMLLLTLAFALTTGSVASPIGNPQNLLIALGGGMTEPFLTFLFSLAVPTGMCLLLIYPAIRIAYPREFDRCILSHAPEPPEDPGLARITRLALGMLVAMIGAKMLLGIAGAGIDLPLTAIALTAAVPVLLFSGRRAEIVRGIDWRTLVFFAALFVLMQSVADTGVFERIIGEGAAATLSAGPILLVSVLASQLVSNVPFVALFLPVLGGPEAPVASLMALAAGSTIAGNLLILGAASNVIIIQNAEKHGHTLGFLEFARIGVPLTAVQLLVYWLVPGVP